MMMNGVRAGSTSFHTFIPSARSVSVPCLLSIQAAALLMVARQSQPNGRQKQAGSVSVAAFPNRLNEGVVPFIVTVGVHTWVCSPREERTIRLPIGIECDL